jgi:hypothetical protein
MGAIGFGAIGLIGAIGFGAIGFGKGKIGLGVIGIIGLGEIIGVGLDIGSIGKGTSMGSKDLLSLRKYSKLTKVEINPKIIDIISLVCIYFSFDSVFNPIYKKPYFCKT